MDRVKGVRNKLSGELGFLVQSVHIRDNLELAADAYRISINGVHVGQGSVQPGRELAINPGHVDGGLEGTPTKDPAFGLDAVWIDPAQREQAQSLGYTVVDASTVVATHLSQQIQRHAHELLSHEAVQQLLDRLAQTSPKLAESLVPTTLSLATVVKVLQSLLAEGVPVRDLRTIAETLVDHGARTQDPAALTAAVREALGRFIVQHITGSAGEVPLITFDPALENMLRQSLGQGGDGRAPAIEPGLAERIQQALRESVQRVQAEGRSAILVVPPELRATLARWLRSLVSGLHVLSYNEIPDDRQLRIVSTVGGDDARLQPEAQGSSAR
jgi:flagellar biosynthesis protein FlhA